MGATITDLSVLESQNHINLVCHNDFIIWKGLIIVGQFFEKIKALKKPFECKMNCTLEFQ